MRIRRARATALAYVCALMLGTPAHLAAQSAPSNFRDAIDYPAVLRQLRSPLDTVRASAYYSLLFEPAKQAVGPFRAMLAS